MTIVEYSFPRYIRHFDSKTIGLHFTKAKFIRTKNYQVNFKDEPQPQHLTFSTTSNLIADIKDHINVTT